MEKWIARFSLIQEASGRSDPEVFIMQSHRQNKPRNRATFLGVPMDLQTMDEALSVMEDAMRNKKRLHHVVVNVAKLVNLQTDINLRTDVIEADLVNIDGMGVVWGARLCKIDVPERVAGVDLMQNLMALCEQKGFSCYFLGAKQDILETAINNIRKQYPDLKIAGFRNGYFNTADEPAIVDEIKNAGTDCLFIAISSPTKERFLRQYRDKLGASVLMGVGGSVDVIAGYVKRAPEWMQNAGLEWFYRVLQEPGRMWKRYLFTNLKFSRLLLKERFGEKIRFPETNT